MNKEIKMKKLFALFTCFLLALALISVKETKVHAFSSGSGSCGDPYVITSPGELDDMADDLDACYVLGNDIDMTGYDWMPIGDYGSPFTGELDGAGYSILNLSSQSPLTIFSYVDAYAMGLFGLLDYDAEIHDLGLTLDFNFNPTLGPEVYPIMIGGIAALIESSDVNIYDVWVSGNIDIITDAESTFGFLSVGGLFGEVNNNTSFSGLSYSGDITVNIGNIDEIDVGGIVGYGLASAFESVYVFDSTFTVDAEPWIEGHVGGVVGYYDLDTDELEYLEIGIVENSIVKNVEIVTSNDNMAGGLFGAVLNESGYDGFVNNNLVQNITIGDGAFYVGGLAGYAHGVDFLQNEVRTATLGSSGQTGEIGGLVGLSEYSNYLENKITGLNITAGDSSDPVGGVVGYMENGTIAWVSVSGNITAGNLTEGVGGFIGEAQGAVIRHSSFDGNIEGYGYIGGLVGYAYTLPLQIRDSWAIISINATGAGIGGLIGYSEVNDVTIDDSYARGDLYGNGYVGGLIGQLYETDTTVYRSYYYGEIALTEYIDGVLGSDLDSILDFELVYFDSTNGTSLYGTPAPGPDFKDPTSDVALAFEAQDQTTDTDADSPWFFSDFVNDGFLGIFGQRNIVRIIDQDTLLELYLDWGSIIEVENTFQPSSNPNILNNLEWGSQVNEPSEPTRTDYIFEGWFEDLGENYEEEWDFENFYYEDTTLRAKWTSTLPNTGENASLGLLLLSSGLILLLVSKKKKQVD
jgi:uncharacterized repeat protein (TIGR02543 family)